jgi:TPP-dependent pyruvate/acetoin dehydrogenase alpha subunit
VDATTAVALECLEQMVVIRAVEEGICAEYSNRNIRGPVHLSIGQEAMAVGVLTSAGPTTLRSPRIETTPITWRRAATSEP